MQKLIHPSFLGPLLIQWSDKGLEKIDIHLNPSAELPLEKSTRKELPTWLGDFLKELDLYLNERKAFSKLPPVNDEKWTAFQKEIYLQLFATKLGETLTYGKLASLCSRPKAARSVGAAMSRNTLPILIPCHRVLPASGKLGNYTGGEGPLSKEKLLHLERNF